MERKVLGGGIDIERGEEATYPEISYAHTCRPARYGKISLP